MFRISKLLTTPTEQLGKASRFLVFQIKLWSHCAKLLIKNRSGLQAAALAYHTIFGLIPLAIVMLLIFQSFPSYSGIGERVKNIVYNQLRLDIEYADPANPEQTIVLTDQLDKTIKNFFSNLNERRIAIVSVLIVIWAALGLLSTIERSFNRIWHVGRGRGFLKRIINYWALLTLGPLLLGIGIYLTTSSRFFGRFEKQTPVPPAIVSYLIATVAFFLLYYILPNTKVKVKPALWASAMAALVWSLAKWGFRVYVIKVIPYSQVYGVLGLIPLTVFWIYITWLIVLFGLHLAFTTQHLKKLDSGEIASAEKTEDCFIANDITAINIVRVIAKAFEANNAPVTSHAISSRMNIPAEFCEKLLNHLVDGGVLIKSSEPRVGYIPAQAPENIRLNEISNVLAAKGFAQNMLDQPVVLNRVIENQRRILAKYNLKQVAGILPFGDGPSGEQPKRTEPKNQTKQITAEPSEKQENQTKS